MKAGKTVGILVLLLVVIGVAMWWSKNRSNTPQVNTPGQTANAPQNMQPINLPVDNRIVLAKVKKLEGKTLTVSVVTKPATDKTEATLEDRSVDVSKAQVFQIVMKSADAFKAEQDTFQKQMANNKNADPKTVTPPNPFEKQPIQLSSLSEGTNVTITANEDATGKTSFTANEVDINPQAPTPAQ